MRCVAKFAVELRQDREVARNQRLDPERCQGEISGRPGAEYLALSAVHGLAMLVIDGPLHERSREEARAIGQRVLDMVEKGL